MSRCHALIIVVAGLCAPASAGPSISAVTVTVRVHDTARLGASTVTPVLYLAARTLRAAAINVTWLRCDASASAAGATIACALPPRPREYIVRLVRSAAATSPAFLVLGDTLVDAGAGEATLATVYADHVEELARRENVDVSLLLGRTLAHEIGHLLLATTTHGSGGLMRAQWSSAELQRNATNDWLFTKQEAAAMHARLQRTPAATIVRSTR